MSATTRRLTLERGDAAAATLLDRNTGNVVLVEGFRYPTSGKGPGWMLEIVAGMVEPGENPEDTIRRETMEETGYRLGALDHVATFYTSPGGSSERVFLFAGEVTATDRVAGGGGVAHEGEDLRVVEIPLAEVEDMLDRGGFHDAKTIIGLTALVDRHRGAGGRR